MDSKNGLANGFTADSLTDLLKNLIYHSSILLFQEIFFVVETAEDYRSITLPYLLADQFSPQWIYNILDHKKEVDRIIFEDEDPVNGFVLLPGHFEFIAADWVR